MLPAGLAECPRCGAKLAPADPDNPQASLKELAWLSGYVVMIALVPVALAVVIGLLCLLFLR
jgi:hypothetical protein